VVASRIVAAAVLWGLLFQAYGLTSRAGGEASPLVLGETFTIDSKILNETRRINVYTPRAYTQSSVARLPVLYMLDGGMNEDFLHVAGLVQVLADNGSMRPCLLVGIENTQRHRDMTGPTTSEEDRKRVRSLGGSKAFRQFIRDELMPSVSSRYRTTARAAIVGESLAGLFVVEAFLREPDLFDTYIAFDPSLWWNNSQLLDEAARVLNARPALKKVLYFASSADDVPSTQRFAAVLEKHAPAGVKWHYERMPEEKHSTIYHPAALRAFRDVFKPTASERPG
jgi:predicted alpha/beta superfamily hydrolase